MNPDTKLTRFEPTPFRCHPLFKHGNAQTVFGTVLPRRFVHAPWSLTGERREFVLPDGDRLVARLHVHPDDPGRTRPVVVLLHGLEGSEDSHYIQGLSLKAHKLGFHSLRLNYRGCGGTEREVQKLYNGHMIEDVDHVLRTLAAEAPWPVVPIGVSLGANMLLRLLATYGDHPPAGVAGAVAISPPIDFHMTCDAFQRGFNKVYDRYFLRKLKKKLESRVQLFQPGDERHERLKRGLAVRWLRQFDEAVTAPEGGFTDAKDYYTRAGVEDGLAAIRVPTLIIHAVDDPIIPLAMFEQRQRMIADNPALTVVYVPSGGHVGFMEHPRAAQPEPWMDHYWAENQAISYVRWLNSR